MSLDLQPSSSACVGPACRAVVSFLQLPINLCKFWQYALSDTQPSCPCWEPCAIIFHAMQQTPPPAPRCSTRGKNDRVQACWQCEDSSTLYIWKSHQLSVVSLSAQLLPSHHQTPFFTPPPLLFHPLLLSFLLTLTYLSHSQLCGVTEDRGITPRLMLQTQCSGGS